ncbi:MAG TPA: hypothetical protein VFO44_02460 [Steroidobacteraceae bacterium]|nr:hypothetical protein [Steroidobacteraceae bacterium]
MHANDPWNFPSPARVTDWLNEAHKEREIASRSQVESEDAAERRAGALAARTRPPPDWITPEPQQPWVGWSERSRGFEASRGALIYHLNDRCAIGVVIVLPVFGCRIGTIEHRGDLFKDLRAPVRFGDWKDR